MRVDGDCIAPEYYLKQTDQSSGTHCGLLRNSAYIERVLSSHKQKFYLARSTKAFYAGIEKHNASTT